MPELPTVVPFIPETITVHLGAPDEAAANVTVPFTEYIKNVASSEIYPTWSESALRANILAITSYALNRVYTEYYRSRGYDFDITNSTAIDQAGLSGAACGKILQWNYHSLQRLESVGFRRAGKRRLQFRGYSPLLLRR